jgi:hypothetical protein
MRSIDEWREKMDILVIQSKPRIILNNSALPSYIQTYEAKSYKNFYFCRL